MWLRTVVGKYFFLFLCIAGLIWYTVYARYIIGRLEMDATQVTETYSELIRAAISEQMSTGEINVVFEKIIVDSDIPIIITDTAGVPIMWKNIVTGTVFSRQYISPDDTGLAVREILLKQAALFKKQYDPKPLVLAESGQNIGWLIYGNSPLIRSLSWIPFLEIGLVMAFAVFVYLALQNIRRTERSNLWVGLAKETAHQLGTPISSLMGWVEYMKSIRSADEEVDADAFIDQVEKICNDMENDLQRLRKVTARFSQIGSKPDLGCFDINGIIEDATQYFRARLPLLGKHITIKTELGRLPLISVNRDLIEWVFENLFKNAIDAIKRDDGMIEVRTEYVEVDRVIRIHNIDNGKGISWEDQKRIFSPGFTTKKRGWGLGLTLAKRIVEDYHHGKIYVNRSQKDKGTEFCIDLPVSDMLDRKTVRIPVIKR
jgi:signal transduction histidine kinase